MVTSEGRIYRATVTWDTESRICVSRYVSNYRDSIQGMSNFFPSRCNFARTDRQLRHVARMNGRRHLKAHMLHSRDGMSRDRVQDFLRRRNASSGRWCRAHEPGERDVKPFLFFSIPSRTPRFTMSRFDNNHGTAWNWNFRASKGRPRVPLQRARVKRASCHSADIDQRSVPFRVCLYDRSAAVGFNVYTRSMYVSSAIRVWLDPYPHSTCKIRFSVISHRPYKRVSVNGRLFVHGIFN